MQLELFQPLQEADPCKRQRKKTLTLPSQTEEILNFKLSQQTKYLLHIQLQVHRGIQHGHYLSVVKILVHFSLSPFFFLNFPYQQLRSNNTALMRKYQNISTHFTFFQ